MTHFVLVHGGVHGAWCWDAVLAPLRDRGHGATAVDLPGRDEQSKDVTLDDWVDTVGRAADDVVEHDGEPPVVVAHSMGGLSASQFAERRPDDVASIVYLGAIVPEHGGDGMSTLAEAGSDNLLLAEAGIVPTPDGTAAVIGPELGARAFYNLCSPDTAAWALTRWCSEPLVPMATPLTLGAGFARVPKAWVAGRHDRIVPLAMQQTAAARIGATFSTLDSDHSPMLSMPEQLVERLTTITSR